MNWTIATMLDATRGRLLQGGLNLPVLRINTDSRQAQPGDAFVPLVGETFDGHDFIAGAVARGVSAVLIQADRAIPAIPHETAVIAVPDTLRALGDLARAWRLQHRIPVVGVTGSNGKTSTKEMLTRILEQNLSVLKNRGNFNNLVGVPLTLLELQSHHGVAVVEMGINVPGEMAQLVDIVRPDVGLITNIQPAHLEGLRSPEDILREKGRLWQALPTEGLAVINVDDERLRTLAQTLSARQLSYSMRDSAADVQVVGAMHLDAAGSRFRLMLSGEVVEITLPVLGIHQAQNAVAAAAIAHGLGVTGAAIAAGLAQHQPVSQRMQVHQLADGTNLVNDTYNANPMSMVAALQAVAAVRRERPVVAVLGEMRELGPGSAALHRQVGRQVGELGLERLITLGDLAMEIGRGAQEAGMSPRDCHHAENHTEAIALLKESWPKGAWIVVKGSRGMRMEKVVEGILAQ
jgi:UDP-N-acetylmuramoyl-tripeptide--D-alanyl-D-alanine ligase